MKGTIIQRGPSSWEIQVYLGRDANGKRIRKTETVRGKKSDAERRRREILSDLDRGIAPPKARYKLGDWLDKWLEDVIIPNRRQKTVDRYEGIIRLHIKPALGHVELAKLLPLQIQDLESKLLQGGMAPKGVQAVHNVLGGAMKHALRMELVGRNPVALVTPPAIPKEESFTPVVKQVLALLAFAQAQGHYLWPCIHLIAYTGMRRGEALALTWANVDLIAHKLVVAQSLVVTTVGVMLQPPKTDQGRRVIDLDEDTVSVLKEHRERQRNLADQLGISPPEIVFPQRDLSGWLHPNTMMHGVKSLAKRAGCSDVTMRSLRHFHATLTLQTRQNPVVVSQRLGHSSTKITMDIYAHALEGWQHDAAEAFARKMRDAG